MSSVTKKELISQFAKECDLPLKVSNTYVNTVLQLIIGNLVEGKEVDITGFGKFEVKQRGVRSGISPVTREKIEIPPCKAVKFTAKKGLKDALNPKED
ncbi:MAG: HU family DNA-binding protein [Allobaculum sp.]